MQLILTFTIPITPVTKKNHQQIVKAGGRYIVVPSKQYKEYEKATKQYIPDAEISERINVKALYYMPTKRRVDLTNLNEALHDCMVKHKCIMDDNSNIIFGTDGSRVLYDKVFPRTEVYIEVEDD